MKKDMRAIRNEAALKAAFRQALEEKPYAEITITEIASRAGLSRSTFYAYYENKEECLKTLFQEAYAYTAEHYSALFETALSLDELNNAAIPDYYDKVRQNATIFLAAFSVFSFRTLSMLSLPVLQDNFYMLQPDFSLFGPDETVFRAFRSTYAHFCLSQLYTILAPPVGHALSKEQFISLNHLWFYIMAKFGGYCPAGSPPNRAAFPRSNS